MVFSSHLFVYYFLPLTLLLYFLLPTRGRNLLLTAASFVFYGWANPVYVVLLLASTLVDYACGLLLVAGIAREADGSLPLLDWEGPRTRRQKLVLAASMASNLALLGFFKYFNFAVDSYNGLVALLGLEGLRLDAVLRVVLPLGISFYTFQSMSYAIDVYRGDARAVRNLVDFLCFESMYPQLVAGPIIRFQVVAEQLARRTLSVEKFARGVAFFSLGMAKKVLLANPCGAIADATFGAAHLTTLDAWWGLLAYAFQIYFDFSGYSDMAIGLGLMLGFVFPKNFDSPYRSESVTEFWRRWHISLSTWLRDYLYGPLGAARKGRRRMYVNLALVMLLGGLWHGASWNFVLWGACHGLLLGAERWSRRPSLWHGFPRPVRIALTFLAVCLPWVLFRARDLPSAGSYFASLLGLGASDGAARLVGGLAYRPFDVLMVGIAALVVWASPQGWEWTERLSGRKALASLAVLALALMVLATQSYNPFIYFIF